MKPQHFFLVIFSIFLTSCNLDVPSFVDIFKGEQKTNQTEPSDEVTLSTFQITSLPNCLEYYLENDILYRADTKKIVSSICLDGMQVTSGYSDYSVVDESLNNFADLNITTIKKESGLQNIIVSKENKSQVFTILVKEKENNFDFFCPLNESLTLNSSVSSGGLITTSFIEQNTITLEPYLISCSEVSYKIWQEVLTWATSDEHGTKKYLFQNLGTEGSERDVGQNYQNTNEPVTSISLCDARVWCNALSEMCNLTPCYVNSSTKEVLRDSSQSSVIMNCSILKNNTGYRLPSIYEWEFSVRCGNFARKIFLGTEPLSLNFEKEIYTYQFSGTDKLKELSNYCNYNSDKTLDCNSLKPNYAGIYDLFGNVFEWTDTNVENKFYAIGGSWLNSSCSINDYCLLLGNLQNNTLGFRIAKSE